MHKILETVDWLVAQDDADTTFESFFSGWFIGAKCSEIKRGNMVVFLAWAMFAKEWSTTSKEERKSIMRMVSGYHYGFVTGSNSRVVKALGNWRSWYSSDLMCRVIYIAARAPRPTMLRVPC